MAPARIIIGNWKMHKTIAEAVAFVKALEATQQTAYLAVPFTAIRACAGYALHSTIGAQNMSDALEGAFTGEISAPMLKDAGARFVLLGHSERRHLFGEDDLLIGRKVARALEQGLRPVLCVGETLAEHRAGQAEQVVTRQLAAGLSGVQEPKDLVVAYEPVWAIGTGENATPEQAQAMHQLIRRWLLGRYPTQEISILYGGSVKPDNAAQLMAQKDVNGVLVGGAALQVDSFLSIIEAGRRE
jgi:triosephosphate isomerase (TIM)